MQKMNKWLLFFLLSKITFLFGSDQNIEGVSPGGSNYMFCSCTYAWIKTTPKGSQYLSYDNQNSWVCVKSSKQDDSSKSKDQSCESAFDSPNASGVTPAVQYMGYGRFGVTLVGSLVDTFDTSVEKLKEKRLEDLTDFESEKVLYPCSDIVDQESRKQSPLFVLRGNTEGHIGLQDREQSFGDIQNSSLRALSFLALVNGSPVKIDNGLMKVDKGELVVSDCLDRQFSSNDSFIFRSGDHLPSLSSIDGRKSPSQSPDERHDGILSPWSGSSSSVQYSSSTRDKVNMKE